MPIFILKDMMYLQVWNIIDSDYGSRVDFLGRQSFLKSNNKIQISFCVYVRQVPELQEIYQTQCSCSHVNYKVNIHVSDLYFY